MTPVSSRVSTCSLTAAERRSNRVARPCAEEHRYGPSNHSDDGFAQSVARITEGTQQRLRRACRRCHVYLHQRISYWDRFWATSPDWIGCCQLGRPLRHLASRPHLACFPGLCVHPVHLDPPG